MTTAQTAPKTGVLSLYLFAALVVALIVASYALAGLGGLVTCLVALTALVSVMMAVFAQR